MVHRAIFERCREARSWEWNVAMPNGTHAAVDDCQVIPFTQEKIAAMNERPNTPMAVRRQFPLAGPRCHPRLG